MKNIILFGALLAYAGLISISCNSRTDDSQHAYPFTVSDGKLILLSVRVADSVDARFILVLFLRSFLVFVSVADVVPNGFVDFFM